MSTVHTLCTQKYFHARQNQVKLATGTIWTEASRKLLAEETFFLFFLQETNNTGKLAVLYMEQGCVFAKQKWIDKIELELVYDLK